MDFSKIKKWLILILILQFLTAVGGWYFQFHKQSTHSDDHETAETSDASQESLIQNKELAFNWSYAAGYCGTDSFKNAITAGKCGVDFSKIPTAEEILTRKLDEYGYPYVQDGEKFFIFYYQDHDKRWQDLKHGDSTVSKSGCGTVCLSMVLTSLTGDIESYTPAKIAKFIRKEHIASPNLSQRSIPVINRCMKTGCKIKKYNGELDLDLVDKTLKKGGYIILDQMAYTGGKGDKIFGAKNHYIVIRAGNQKKGYYIANPLYGYSKKNSIAKYAPQNTTRIPAKRFSSLYYYTILPPESE